MTIKQFIEKSIKGGYVLILEGQTEPLPKWDLLHGSYDYKILLDPDVWRCAGKEMGWENKKIPLKEYSRTGEMLYQEEYLWRWHNLINNLFDGGSIEEYFESL